jgi:hypothetical protein
MAQTALFRRSLGLVLLLVIPSCSRQSSLATQPDVDASATRNGIAAGGLPEGRAGAASKPGREAATRFYPLEVGNEWTYSYGSVDEILSPAGGLIGHSDSYSEWRRSIVCETTIDQKKGFVQRSSIRVVGSTTERSAFSLLREDRDGLHEVFPRTAADPCAQTISLAGALMTMPLQYPLHPGATWTVRGRDGARPAVVATVEKQEVITIPAGRFRAYRIRLVGGDIEPEAVQYVWYGKEGWIPRARKTGSHSCHLL